MILAKPRRRLCGPIAIRGVVGDQQAATVGRPVWNCMLKSTMGRAVCAAQYGRCAGAVTKPAADHHRLSAGWQAHPGAGRLDLYRRRCGAMVARRLKIIGTAADPGPAETADPVQDLMVPAFTGGAPYWNAECRGASGADAQFRRGRICPWRCKASGCKPETCLKRWRDGPLGGRCGTARGWRHVGKRLDHAISGRYYRRAGGPAQSAGNHRHGGRVAGRHAGGLYQGQAEFAANWRYSSAFFQDGRARERRCHTRWKPAVAATLTV